MPSIFISYAHEDKTFVDQIAQTLVSDSFEVWVDDRIPKGVDWEQEIYRNIEESEVFLFMLSVASVASEICNKEIEHATQNSKRILPIFIANVDDRGIYGVTEKFLYEEQKKEICRHNFVKCRDGRDDFEKALDEIQTAIDTDYEWLKYHTRLQVKALEWERTKDASRLLRGKELREADEYLAEVGREKEPHSTELQQSYLWNSRRNEERQRKRITIGLTVGFLIMLGITIVAVWQWQRADRQTKIALARQLAAQAQSIYTTGDSKQLLSILLAIQSMRMFPSIEASQVLQNNTLMPVISHYKLDSPDNLVNSVTFSPDGNYVVSGSGSTVCVWEVSTGKEIAKVTHSWDVSSVAFSPSGKYFVSGSYDKTVKVWETFTGKEIARMTHDSKVLFATFSPDNKYVVSGSEDGTARVWEAKTGREVSKVAHDGWVVSLAISPDSKYVVSADGDSTARVWELATGKEIAKMVHESGVYIVAFSPDGKFVVSSGCDERDKPGLCIKSTVRVWETSSGREISRVAHDNIVKSIAFSPNGMYVVSGSWDGTASVWETITGKLIAKTTHDGWVNSVAFSPDGKYIVSGSNDSTARVWEAATGKEVARMTHGIGGVNSVDFSPDGNLVVSGGYREILVWKIILDKEVSRMVHSREVISVSFSPDGIYVISGSKDGIVHVWDSITGIEMYQINIGDDDVFSFDYSADGRYIASGGCQYHESASCDLGTVRVWDVSVGQEIARMTQEGRVYSVAFSPDGKYVAYGGAGDSVHVWDITTGEEITCKVPAGAVASVAFSEDGRYVVLGSPGFIQLLEAATCKEISRMIAYGEVLAVAISPDGETVASSGSGGTIRLWEVATSNEIARLNTLDNYVTSIIFSPDGNYLASGNSDGTARVWETTNGLEIARMKGDGSVNSVTFSRDGKYLLSGSADKTARVWIWRSNDLINKACSRVTRNLTSDEWKNYVGDILPYQAVCANLPIESEIKITP